VYLDRSPTRGGSITHPSSVSVVVVVARTELERVEPIITRKRPLKVRRSLRTRHPKRARARFSASHDRTASDGGSSLRRRAKAVRAIEKTKPVRRAASVVPFERLRAGETNQLKLFTRDFASTGRATPVARRASEREIGRMDDVRSPEISRGRYGFPRRCGVGPIGVSVSRETRARRT
jgi:hypothetical protein